MKSANARRWLSVLLALVMVIGMLPVSALAADDVTEPETPAVCTHPSVTDYVCDDCGLVVLPAADSTLTVNEANVLGLALSGVYTADKYYVTGTVVSVAHATYGNMTIEDAEGNTLQIYGSYDADGSNRYGNMYDRPIVGSVVTLYGVIGSHNNTAQMKDGWIVENTPPTIEVGGTYAFLPYSSDGLSSSFRFTAPADGVYVFYTYTYRYNSYPQVGPYTSVTDSNGNYISAPSWKGFPVDDGEVYATYIAATAGETYTILFSNSSCRSAISVYLAERQLAQSLELDEEYQVQIGSMSTLSLNDSPALSVDDYYVWESSDESVVVFDEFNDDSLVGRNLSIAFRGVGAGTATVTVTGYPSGATATTTVTVTPADYTMGLDESFSMEMQASTVNSFAFTAPEDGEYLFYYNNIWALNSWTVNGVDGTGYETRDWKGVTVNLTAGQVAVFEIHNNTGENASFEVGMATVREATGDEVSLEAVVWKCYTGFSYKLRAMMEPGLVLPADVVWASANQDVLTIEGCDRDGIWFYCEGEGSGEISLQVGEHTYTIVNIPVVYSEAEMELDQSYMTDTLYCGQTVRYSFTPEESGTYTLLIEGMSDGYSFGVQDSNNIWIYPQHGARGDYRLVQMDLTAGVTYRFGLGHEHVYQSRTAKLSIHKTVPLTEATVTLGGSTEEYVAEMDEYVELWVTYDPIYTEITGYVDWVQEGNVTTSYSDLDGWEGVARMNVESCGSLTLTATVPNLAGESITVSRTVTVPLPSALALGEKASVTSVQDGWVYYSFTPEISCEYLFRSYGDWDTVGRVMRVSDGYSVECDDFNNSLNFGVGMWMDAGETYLLGARMIGWNGDVTFDVAIEHGNVGELTETDRQNATCTEDGYIHYVCNTCGYEWTEILPCGHVFEDGWCTVCGQEEIYSGTCGENVQWELSGVTGVLRIFGTGAMADYELEGAPWYGVREIVKSIVVEQGVTRIGQRAFEFCEWAESVSIADSVTYIGNHAFEFCYALEQVSLSENITELGYKVFSYSGLTSLTLPASLTEMRGNPISECKNLKGIYVAEGSTTFKSVDGVLYSADGTVLRAVPWYVTEFDIPDGVTTVGVGAFYDCHNLERVSIPESVTTLELDAFLYCRNLKEVTLPSTLTYIGESAFRCTGLTEIVIPDGVTEISHRAFAETDLAYLIIPAGVQVIGGEFLRESGTQCVVFEGSKPALDVWATSGYYSNIWYPANDASWDGIELESYGGNPTWNVMQGPVLLQCSGDAVTYVGGQVTMWAEFYYTTDLITYHWYYQDENYDWVEIENEVSNSLTFTAAENNPTQYRLVAIDENGDANNVYFDLTVSDVLTVGSNLQVQVSGDDTTSVLIKIDEAGVYTLNTVESTGNVSYNGYLADQASGSSVSSRDGAFLLHAGLYALDVWSNNTEAGSITLSVNEVPALALGESVTGTLVYDEYVHYVFKPEVDVLVTVSLNGGDGYSFYDYTAGEYVGGDLCSLTGGHIYLFSFRTYADKSDYTLTLVPPVALTDGETAEVQIPNATEYWFTFTPETDGFIVRNINTASGSYSYGSLHTNDGEQAEDWGWGLYYVHKDVTYRFHVSNWSGDTTTVWVSIHMAKDLALGESYDVTLTQRGEKTLFAFTPESDGFYQIKYPSNFNSDVYCCGDDDSEYVESSPFYSNRVFYAEAGQRYLVCLYNYEASEASGTVSLTQVGAVELDVTHQMSFAGYDEIYMAVVTPEEDGFYNLTLSRDMNVRISTKDGEWIFNEYCNSCSLGLTGGEPYVIMLRSNSSEVVTVDMTVSIAPEPESVLVNMYEDAVITETTASVWVNFEPYGSGALFDAVSSNTDVLAVQSIRGSQVDVYGVSAGTAELTVTTANGKTATVTVTVEDPVTLTLGEETEVEMDRWSSEIFWMYTQEEGVYVLALPEDIDLNELSCGGVYLDYLKRRVVDGVQYIYFNAQANARYNLRLYNREHEGSFRVGAYKTTAPTAIVLPDEIDMLRSYGSHFIQAAFASPLEFGYIDWEIVSGTEYGYISWYGDGDGLVGVGSDNAGQFVLRATCGEVSVDVTVNSMEEQAIPDGGELTLNGQSIYGYTFTAAETGWYAITDPGEGVEVQCDKRTTANGQTMYLYYVEAGQSCTVILENTSNDSVSYTLAPTLCPAPESAVIVPVYDDGWQMGFTVEFEPFGSYTEGEWSWEGDSYYSYENQDGVTYFYCNSFGTVTYTWEGGSVSYDVVNIGYRPYLSMGWLYNWGDGLFYDGGSGGNYFGCPAYGAERGVWLLNTCDPETREWTATPIGLEDLTWDSELTMMSLWETGENIMEGAEYADKYVYLTPSSNAVPGTWYNIYYQMGDTTVTASVFVNYNNGTYHSEAQLSRDNWLEGNFTIDLDAEENVFYFVQDNPGWTIEYFAAENGGEYVSIEQVDERTLKITVLENRNFRLNLRVGSETEGWDIIEDITVSLPPVPVELGQMHTVTVMDGEWTWMTFTPEVSCNYVFLSCSDGIDPVGCITDADGNLLTMNDDHEGLNFYMEEYLEAGVTYMLGARAYNGGKVSYEVKITHAPGGNVTELERMEPTCETDGYIRYSCGDCGLVWTEILPGGHQFDDGWCTVCGDEEIYSGTCGEGLTWVLSGATGVLEISGTGAMESYYNSDAPWFAHWYLIRTVVVEEGVTTIGEQAFEDCHHIEEVILPKGLAAIETAAFFGCHNLYTLVVPSGAELTILDGAFADNGIRTLIFEGSAPTFAEGAFVENLGMTVYYPANDPTWTEDVMQNYGAGEGVEIVWQAIAGPMILNRPELVFGAVGYETKITVEAYSITGEMTYLWQYSDDDGETWVNLSDTDNVLNLTASAADANRMYRCVVSDETGSVDSGAMGVYLTSGIAEGEFVKVPAKAEGDDFVVYHFIPEVSGHYYIHSAVPMDGDGWYDIATLDLESVDMDRFGVSYLLEAGKVYVVALGYMEEGYSAMIRKEGELNVGSETLVENMPVRQAYSLSFHVEEEGAYVLRASFGFDRVIVDTEGNYIDCFGYHYTESYVWTYFELEAGDYTLYMACSGLESYNATLLFAQAEPADSFEVAESITMAAEGNTSITARPADPMTFIGEWKWEIVEGDDVIQINWESMSEIGLTALKTGTAKLKVTGDGMVKTVTITVKEPEQIKLGASETVTLGASSQAAYTLEITEPGLYSMVYPADLGREIYGAYDRSYFYETGDLACMVFEVATAGTYRIILTNYENAAVQGDVSVMKAGTPTGGEIYEEYSYNEYKSLTLAFTPAGSYADVEWTVDNEDVAYIDAMDGIWCVVVMTDPDAMVTVTATWDGGSAEYVIGAPVVEITKQPVSVTVAENATAKVTLEATGDGLTYAWYWAEAGSETFYLTKSFTGNSYAVSMTADRDGRRIYCVVTDQYGNSVQSDVVTLSMEG